MKFARNIFVGVSAASLALTPAVAGASPRASQDVEEASALGGGTGLIFIAALVAVVALAVIASSNDDDLPVSP